MQSSPSTTHDVLKAAPRSGRLLAVAYCCDPYLSMESRVGWQRVMQAARNHQVWVLHSGRTPSETLAKHAADEQPQSRIHFVAVPNCWLGSACDETFDLFWQRYRLWQRQALRVARQLHRKHRFHLVHQINFCSFREPGDTWRLGIPFVWGPIGGTHNLPAKFLSQCDLVGGAREVTRAVVNWWQLNVSRRIRRAAKSATTVFAASHAAQRDLARHLGIEAKVMLETGIGAPLVERREPPNGDRPLRLLWAGRQRTWKGFPLLTQAIAKLPKDFNYELTVLGVGQSHDGWRRQAERLGVADRIRWVGWPEYADTLPYYSWADAFLFTSLRDTSGTGLLESLAAGTPIIGLDHQGAADIMSAESAMPIAVHSPEQVARDVAAAIVTLGSDPDLWSQKSLASQQRAKQFQWSVLAARMEQEYQRVLSAVPAHDTAPLTQPAAKHAVESLTSHLLATTTP
jgi:glycosyltransferase involved in cell wall biosynthesis